MTTLIKSSISCSKSSPCKSCVELENLENALAKQRMKQYELKRNINRIHSPFIRVIPPEIIAKISGFAITNFAITNSLPDAILLSSICSDWRRAVVETPELWSSVKINLPAIPLQTSEMATSSTLRLPRLATFIDKWLSRSGQLPLNISLCYNNYHDWDDIASDPLTQEQYRPIFKILDQYSSRWRRLNIFVPSTLLQLLQRPERLPKLERLHIASCMSDSADPSHIINFPRAPCLTTVEIQQYKSYKLPTSPFIGIHWDTVTHLSVTVISKDTLLMVLRKNPQLVHCTFRKVCSGSTSRINPSPIVSSLTYLSIHHFSGPSQILDCITLPCLETLVLGNVTSTNSNPIISFLKRSVCSLHTLSLLNCHDKKIDKYLPLLQFLSPTLTRLAISRDMSTTIGTQGFLSLLTQIYTSPNEAVGDDFLSFPHLEIFEYREASSSTLDISVLSNLPSRNCYPKPATTSIPLRLVYISRDSISDTRIPNRISDILQRLEEDGILIYI